MSAPQIFVISGDPTAAQALIGGRGAVLEVGACNGEIIGAEAFLINVPDFHPEGAAIVWRIDAVPDWPSFPDFNAAADWLRHNRREESAPAAISSLSGVLSSLSPDAAGSGPVTYFITETDENLTAQAGGPNEDAAIRESRAPAPSDSAGSSGEPGPAEPLNRVEAHASGDWTPEYPDERPDAVDMALASVEGVPEITRSVATAASIKAMRAADIQAGLAEPWPEPVDVFAVSPLPDMDASYLPEPIAEYVLDQADRAGVDPAMVSGFCLVACAGLLRHGIKLRMQADGGEGRTWHENPVLWFAGVGNPSIGKGPAMDIAFHQFNKIAGGLRAGEEAARKRYENDAAIHKLKVEAYRREAAKNAQVMPPDSLEPLSFERLWTDDATKEKAASLCAENSRRKITLVKDELAAWFGSMGAYSGAGAEKDRADWLTFYESRERYIDRMSDGKSIHVPSWGGCIAGGVQPSVLSRISAKLGDDGMLQRFMLVVAKQKRFVEPRRADALAVKRWVRVQETLAAMQADTFPVSLSPEAAEFMAEKVHWLYDVVGANDSDALTFALGKWEGLFGRLMITAHCIADADSGARMPSQTVGLRVAEQSWHWLRYLLYPHAVRFYGESSPSESDRMFLKFCTYILARTDGRVSLAELQTGERAAWKSLDANPSKELAMILRLMRSGILRPATAPRSIDRLPSHYAVSPLFYERNAHLIEAEDERRKAEHKKVLVKQGREPGED